MADLLFKSWSEIVFIMFMILGALIAITVPAKPISYAIILLSGFAAGKVIYDRRYSGRYPRTDWPYFIVEQFPYLLMVTAFVIGYMVGAYNLSRRFIFLLFMVSLMTSYYLHHKKIFIDKR